MSKWIPLVVGSLFLATATACNGNRGDNSNTGGAESGSMQSGTATDTGMSGGGGGGVGDTAAVRPGAGTTPGSTGGESADTARNTGTSDSANAKNQPVTGKGDTVRSGSDSTAVGQQ
jgi:hypothetical protein